MASLNPDLYRGESVDSPKTTTQAPGGCCLRFSLKYDDAKEWLDVVVKRVKTLPANLSEIFIKYDITLIAFSINLKSVTDRPPAMMKKNLIFLSSSDFLDVSE